MDMLALFQTLYDSSLANAIRTGATAFPWIESVHVVAITLVVGTIAIVDLRLLGYSAHRRGARQLIVDLLPYTWAAFGVAIIAGSLMFISNAVAYAQNGLFEVKMVLIAAAGVNMAIFHLTAYRQIREWDEAPRPPLAARIAGALSLVLWISVIFVGRWVGFTLSPF